MVTKHKTRGYMVAVALENGSGWSAALVDYGCQERYEALVGHYGPEIPKDEPNTLLSFCGHRHRSPQACKRCFPKLRREQRGYEQCNIER